MTEKIESLPERPLTMREGDELVESGGPAPLVMKQWLPSESEPHPDHFSWEGMPTAIFGLLYATEERGVTVAYSGEKGHWVKVLELDAEEYDIEQVETETRDFVRNESVENIEIETDIDVSEL
jgi:hypothetical protein